MMNTTSDEMQIPSTVTYKITETVGVPGDSFRALKSLSIKKYLYQRSKIINMNMFVVGGPAGGP